MKDCSSEFVGMVSDNPNKSVKLKTFHCNIFNDPSLFRHRKQLTSRYRKCTMFQF